MPYRGLVMFLVHASAVYAFILRPVVAQTPTPATAVTAFVDVAVIPMDRERVLPHQTVVVRGDRVVTLGRVGRVRVPAEAQRIDGRGRYLIPGLGDMHVHVSTYGVLVSYLANGVTTVRDMHSGSGTDSPALQMKRAVANGTQLGPRIYTAGDIRYAKHRILGDGTYPFPRDVPDSGAIATVADSTAQLKRDGYDFVKLYAWPSPIYDSVVAAATRVGLGVVGHVPAPGGSVYLQRVFHDRWRSIEHLTGYFAAMTNGFREGFPLLENSRDTTVRLMLGALDTATWMQPGHRWDSTQIRKLAVATRSAGVWNCPTLIAYQTMYVQFKSDMGQMGSRWYAHWIELVLPLTKALQEAGAGLLLGADEPRFGTVLDELRIMVTKVGLTPYQALATGTKNVAVFLGTLDSTGTVAVGKRADLVLLESNPLDDIRATASRVGVMVGGRWLTQAELDEQVNEAQQAGP